MNESLEKEVAVKEAESVKAEAMEREFNAREHDNMGVLGDAGEAAEATETFARAERMEEAVKDGSSVGEIAAEDAMRIDNAADKA